jgi:two-component system response regulator NreC
VTEKIRILIVDDHGVMRAGLRALLETQPDMEVVGEAGDGERAVQMAREIVPDVVVLDLELPGMSGIRATKEIRETCPDTHVLALTMHEDKSFVRAVMAAGGAGYIAKNALGDELVSAIRTVHKERTYINVPYSRKEAESFLDERPEGRTAKAGKGIESLSDRERQVLELLAQGYTNQQIGERLHLSTKTIGTYRFRLSEKLGLDTRADIVRFALEIGLLGPIKRR